MIHERVQTARWFSALIRSRPDRALGRYSTVGVVILSLVILAVFPVRSLEKKGGPSFWRGVYLFGMRLPESDRARAKLLETLSDSLHLNVVQVRTYGHAERERFFLGNSAGLWVLLQDQELALSVTGNQPEAEIERIEGRLRTLETRRMLLRYYLIDEPAPKHFAQYKKTSQRVSAALDEDGSAPLTITTLAEGGRAITDFVDQMQPAELVIDPYFITNNMPHPSLKGRDDLAERVGILPWGAATEGYGWYFGFLQDGINKALEEHHRVAAEAVRTASSPVRLVIAPQLHGILFCSTVAYDRDTSRTSALYLRPPAPSEISLQYGLGLAYGAKGFLGYPYGYDAGYEKMEEIYTGLVSGDPSGVDHVSNLDTLYGRASVWTGYAEKWGAFKRNNRRLSMIGDTLAALTWVGAKSWTMNTSWKPVTRETSGWDGSLIAGVELVIEGDPYPQLPQIEIGHLKRPGAQVLVLVNRRCAPSDRAAITIRFGGSGMWRVRDLEDPGRNLGDQTGKEFSDVLEPGEWRLYSLERQ